MPIRFQVDPDFYDHPKVLSMSDAAFALWVRAGSYCAAKTSDGFVPEEALSLFSETQKQAAGELVQRGLWRRVRGGFRYHQWDQRNLTRARVDADRTYERERKQRQRQKARSTEETQVNGAIVPRDNHRDSRRDSGRSPSGSVSMSVSESVSGSVSGRDSPTADPSPAPPPGPEPPSKCPTHHDDPDPPPCGACADARRDHERWQHDQQLADQARRSAAARSRAAAARAAIDSCRLCDDRGYLPGGRWCLHDPSRLASAGAAAARAAARRGGRPKESHVDPPAA